MVFALNLRMSRGIGLEYLFQSKLFITYDSNKISLALVGLSLIFFIAFVAFSCFISYSLIPLAEQ